MLNQLGVGMPLLFVAPQNNVNRREKRLVFGMSIGVTPSPNKEAGVAWIESGVLGGGVLVA